VPPRVSGTEPEVVSLARAALAEGLAALAAQDIISALRWLERAHRLVPNDLNATLALASACLETDPARASSLFGGIVRKHDVRQAWLGLAAVRLRLNQPEAATEAMAAVLSRHAFLPDAAVLADRIGGRDGWCALRSDGDLQIPGGTALRMTLDGKRLGGRKLPPDWARSRVIEIRRNDEHLLGSPIRIDAIRRVAGCVEVHDGGIRGWAWHPNDPDTAPVLTVGTLCGGLQQTIVAIDESVTILDTGPLGRPRSFNLTNAELSSTAGLIHVRGPDGKDVAGSPLDPFADEAARVAAALRIGQIYPARSHGNDFSASVAGPLRADAPAPVRPVGADGRQRAVTIVIPVHDGGPVVLACLASVLASVSTPARVMVIDDGSSDPELIQALDDLARRRKITLLRHPRTQGFPASANAGIRAAKERDVVLLNSDTLVPPNWLQRLSAAAYSARDVGTATPLSNDASILSHPGPAGINPRPDQAATNRLDRLADLANGAATVDIPVGVGFCLYLRRDCLNAVGVFRADIFAQGYGEENDLCLRARRLGWRSVAATGVFVGHVGGTSFGGSAIHLRRRNSRIIEQLHPGYQTLIDDFLAADPLHESRRRIDMLSWKRRRRKWPPAAILITHNDGGGVEQLLARSVRSHVEAGRRPIVLRPAETATGQPAIAIHDGLADDLPNLAFAMPNEGPALLRLLRLARPDRIEAHHLAEYSAAIYGLIAQLGLPYDVHVHDYAWVCPRVSLVPRDRYCGEPDVRDCDACVADNGRFLKEDIAVAALRQRSGRFLADARRVVVPSEDTAIRIRRYFPDQATVVIPHGDDTFGLNRRRTRRRDKPIVCVVGAIGVHKGYDVLLACARDAVRRDLDLEFVIVGHTVDDARLMETGRVFVTGPFKPDEAVDLIAAQNASLGFVPSITPETWCLSLGEIWRAGLFAAAFDIGAPAERIRQTENGIVLPLGLSPDAINNALVATIRTQRH
jgi:GT2 family glycosyltransferase